MERERRLAYLERELDLARNEATSQIRGLASLASELERLQVTARGQATRIRLQALREAAEVSDHVHSLSDAPEGSSERLLSALHRAIDRLGATWNGTQEPEQAAELRPEPGPPSQAALAPSPQPEAAREPESKAPLAEPAEELAELEAGLDAGGELRVLVDVGPFSDFSQLVTFEDAANAIEATGEIAIRHFSGGRASIEVALRNPVDLRSELEARCELAFVVRSSSAEELILDLSE